MTEILDNAKPTIIKKRVISAIWILPLLAVFIGLAMLYNDWKNRGVVIQISFDTAAGISAGKTKIKSRNVDIGIVESVSFDTSRKFVIVEAEIDNEMADFLREDSQFWVVRPRIGKEGITDVGTLLSGAYIEVAAGRSPVAKEVFVGLESPPITTLDADGLHLTLISAGGKPLGIGDPVIYRGFEVGKVESFDFNPDEREARYRVFIHAPFNALVTSNTYFWNAGGISISSSAEGLRVDVASLETFLSGGVEFDVPEDLTLGKQIGEGAEFSLYDSRQSVDDRRKYDYVEYVLLVEDSVGGLYKGAPVDYRGVRIGTVHNPHMNYGEVYRIAGDKDEDRIPVIIRLEPGRVDSSGELNLDNFEDQMDDWISRGITASIESNNFITGSLKVSLDYGGEAGPTSERFGSYPVIPVSQRGFSGIAKKLDNIIAKIEALPLDTTLANANKAIVSADEALLTLDETLRELKVAVRGLQPESNVYLAAQETMDELQSKLDGVEPILKELKNKPNSLVFGVVQPPDIEPKAQQKGTE